MDKQEQKQEQEGDDGRTASGVQSEAVHSLAEGVGDAVETLRSRVDSVVEEVDKALKIPHFTETQYANLHSASPERVEKVKDYTEAVDHDKEELKEKKEAVNDLSQSMNETIEVLLDTYDTLAKSSGGDINTPSNR